MLKGKKGLVSGISNRSSIAWGCAKAFCEAGAEIALTYANEKRKDEIITLSHDLPASIVLPLDVQNEEQIKSVFTQVESQWGGLDFFLHSIAYSPKEDLHGRVVDCSREGFLMAMDISCYSFIRMAHYIEPLMKKGGCLLTVSYYGGERVVGNYNMMGPVKSALEGAVKYLAAELGEKGIRVNALSPGAILTRAASGIASFDELLEKERIKTPSKELPTIEDVGAFATFLVSDQARHITGNISYIDSGSHIMG